MSSFSLVTSAQNTAYCGWQALLFAFSARQAYGQVPVIAVVHGDPERPLEPEFRLLIEKTDVRVVRAIDYAHLRPDIRYVPFNSPGSLIHAATVLQTDLAVLCDGDFLFLEAVDFGGLGVAPGVMTMDNSDFMTVEGSGGCAGLPMAVQRAGMPLSELATRCWGAVPYTLHRQDAMRFGRKWRDMISHFAINGGIHWISVMWGAVMAVHRLGLELRTTRVEGTNHDNMSLSRHPYPIIHYAHGGRNFDKRNFCFPTEKCRAIWDLRPIGDGTIDDRIRLEIERAALFYGIDDPDIRRRILA
jgi:hypothetical protein